MYNWDGNGGSQRWAPHGRSPAAARAGPALPSRRAATRAQPPLINIRSRSLLRTTFMVPFNETAHYAMSGLVNINATLRLSVLLTAQLNYLKGFSLNSFSNFVTT